MTGRCPASPGPQAGVKGHNIMKYITGKPRPLGRGASLLWGRDDTETRIINIQGRRQRMKRSILIPKGCVLLCVSLLMAIPNLSSAQTFPTKPMSILIGFGPGGNFDIATRILASKAEKFLGQSFVINNNGAGGGAVALGIVAKQKADGYNIASCTSTGLVRLPKLQSLSYKLEDFTPVMCFTGGSFPGLVVKASSPYKSLKDLIEYARKHPGDVTYSTTGVGGGNHLAMEVIGKKEGITWTHIPYPGSAPALTALLGDHVSAQSGDSTWIPYVKDGTLRLLATYGEHRMRNFPGVPTIRELGYDYVSDVVYMLAVPKETRADIVKKLDEAFHKATQNPEFIQTLEKMELATGYRGSEEMKKYLAESSVRFNKMLVDFRAIFDQIKEPQKK